MTRLFLKDTHTSCQQSLIHDDVLPSSLLKMPDSHQPKVAQCETDKKKTWFAARAYIVVNCDQLF